MKQAFVLCVALLLLNTSCMQRSIHQGNEIAQDKVWLIQAGDTKFQVESEWGTPAILDPLHPNRVEYVQQVHDLESKEQYVRGMIVEYDAALRVKSIERFGFKE